MNRMIFLGIILIAFILSGCNGLSTNSGKLSGDKPPNLNLEIDGKKYETVLGSYCWGRECIDTAGTIELLEEKSSVQIQPGEQIIFMMDYTPKPNEVTLIEERDNGDKTEVKISDDKFTAPVEPGIYYYTYSAWWMDEIEVDLSHGDAFYAFSLEVQ